MIGIEMIKTNFLVNDVHKLGPNNQPTWFWIRKKKTLFERWLQTRTL